LDLQERLNRWQEEEEVNNVKVGKMPTLKWLKIDDIKVPEGRLHSRFKNFKDFEESIKIEGVIQPIHVFEDKDGVLWLAEGQNRLETAKKYGKPIIQAYVLHGTREDALLYSAKLNILRGKVNVGELAEFVEHLHNDLHLTQEKIANELHKSKGYINQLLQLAKDKALLEKVKIGEISGKEAIKKVLGLTVKPISEEKGYFPEKSQKQGLPVSGSGLSVKRSAGAIEEKQLMEDESEPKTKEEAAAKGRIVPVGPEVDLDSPEICVFDGVPYPLRELRKVYIHRRYWKPLIEHRDEIKSLLLQGVE
jgi:ParB/RepB/Spo0J family partition protein